MDNFVDKGAVIAAKAHGGLRLLDYLFFLRPTENLIINGLDDKSRGSGNLPRVKPHEIGMNAIL